MINQRPQEHTASIEAENWTIFLCYRQIDGKGVAEWINGLLADRELPFIPGGHTEPPVLSVYFDQTTPAVGDWREIHLPSLERSRAMLFVASPGAQTRQGGDDWVHQELTWWIDHREAAPIILDPTGEGDRWLPEALRARWPTAQRLPVDLDQWDALPEEQKENIESRIVQRIMGGIRLSEDKARREDLERERSRRRQLEAQGTALRRQRLLLAALLALALLATVGLLFMTQRATQQERLTEQQRSIASTQRDLATQALDEAQEVTHFLIEVFNTSDPEGAGSGTATAREILDKGAERVEAELASKPLTQAAVMNVLGIIYRTLGLYEEAKALFDRALGVRRSMLGERHLYVAETMHDLGGWYYLNGEYDLAESYHRDALEVRREQLSSGPLVASALSGLALALQAKNSFPEAEKYYREALTMMGNGRIAEEVMNNYAVFLIDVGRYPDAESWLRDLVELKEERYGSESAWVSLTRHNLAVVLAKLGREQEAIALYRRVLEIDRKELGEDHPDVANDLNSLGVALHNTGNHDEAERSFRKSLLIYSKRFGDNHPDTANALQSLGASLREKGDLAEAETLLRQSLNVRRNLFAEHTDQVSLSLTSLGILLEEKGDYVAASELQREALSIRREIFDTGHPRIAANACYLSRCLYVQGNISEAARLYNEARAIWENKGRPTHPGKCLESIAELLLRSKRSEEALRFQQLVDLK